MALARIKVWSSEILTSSDLNAEFNNILNNPLSLISPLTGDLAAGGNKITGLSLGSEGSPSLQFTGDTNTGIMSAGADLLGFSTGGSERWRIHSSGHLLAVDDATYDIGASGATMPRSLYVSDITANGILYGTTGKKLASSGAVAYGQVLQGNASAVPALAYQPVYVRKASDETVNNSNTLQDDDALVFAIAANGVYWVEVFLILSATTSVPDFLFGWTVPASCTMLWGGLSEQVALGGFGPAGTSGTPTSLKTESTTLAIASVNGTIGASLGGIVTNSTNAGNLQLQWAQNTANASDSKVLANSFMRVIRLA